MGGAQIAMGAISALGGLAAAIGSAAEASHAAKEIRGQHAMLEAQRNEQEGLFNRRYYQDILDRAEVQSMLREYNEQEEAARKQANATTAILGSTDEERMATTNSENKSRANFLSGIAQNANILKDQLATDWRNRLDNYYNGKMGLSDKIAGLYQNTSNQLSQASANAFASAANMFGGVDWKSLGKNNTPVQEGG